MATKVTKALRLEQRDYYALCSEAREQGIPVDVDDPRSPNTVEALRQAVDAANRE